MPWAFLQRGKRGDPVPAEYRPVAWRGLPYGAAPWEQIGVYGDVLLNQYPAYYNQPQLHCGVEYLQKAWYTPTAGVLPYWLQTPRPVNIPGGQRVGAPAGAPVGPISALANAARVTQAQVRQSGASAMAWAAGLSGG